MAPTSYNDQVKKPGLEEEYSAEYILELQKCSTDPVYFIETYVQVLHPDKGYIPFLLYPHQRRMLEAYHKNRFVISKVTRQAGKTTICAAYMLWYICFNEDKTCGIVSNKESSAKEVLSRVKSMYELLPTWIKPGAKNYEQTFAIFENGSRIIAAATSKNSFRGWTINGILLADEFAHVHRNLQHDFWSSNYPTISASKYAKVIIISTPNGMYDLFHEIYLKAENGRNDFVFIDVHWSEHPERDEKWLKAQRKALGETLFTQEVLCVAGDTEVTILNTKTNKIETIKIGELYERLDLYNI